MEEISLDRFVDQPDLDEQFTSIPIRQSFDSIVNPFGHKLISLCKENDLKIVNGRLEPGRFTFEPHREKTGFLHMQKQRRRSASR